MYLIIKVSMVFYSYTALIFIAPLLFFIVKKQLNVSFTDADFVMKFCLLFRFPLSHCKILYITLTLLSVSVRICKKNYFSIFLKHKNLIISRFLHKSCFKMFKCSPLNDFCMNILQVAKNILKAQNVI